MPFYSCLQKIPAEPKGWNSSPTQLWGEAQKGCVGNEGGQEVC